MYIQYSCAGCTEYITIIELSLKTGKIDYFKATTSLDFNKNVKT